MTNAILMLLVPTTVVLAIAVDLAAPSDLDVGERPQSRPPPRGARLRADARGGDGGDAPNAAIYEQQLPRARAIVARLRGR